MTGISRRKFLGATAAGVGAAVRGMYARQRIGQPDQGAFYIATAGVGLYVASTGPKRFDVYLPTPPVEGVVHDPKLVVLRQTVLRRPATLTASAWEKNPDCEVFNVGGLGILVDRPAGSGALEVTSGSGPIDNCPPVLPLDYRHIINLRSLVAGVRVRSDVAGIANVHLSFSHGVVNALPFLVPQNTIWRWRNKSGKEHRQFVSPGMLWTGRPASRNTLVFTRKGTAEEVDRIELAPAPGESSVCALLLYFPRTAAHGHALPQPQDNHLRYVFPFLSGVASPDDLAPSDYVPCGKTPAPYGSVDVDDARFREIVSKGKSIQTVMSALKILCGEVPQCVPTGA